MKISVEFGGKSRKIQVPGKAKVAEVIRKMGINPETVIVRRGENILLETEKLNENDRLEFIRIVSGG